MWNAVLLLTTVCRHIHVRKVRASSRVYAHSLVDLYIYISVLPSKTTMIVAIIIKTKIIISSCPNTKVMDPYADFMFSSCCFACYTHTVEVDFKPFSATSWTHTLVTAYSFLFFLAFSYFHFGHLPIPSHPPASSSLSYVRYQLTTSLSARIHTHKKTELQFYL